MAGNCVIPEDYEKVIHENLVFISVRVKGWWPWITTKNTEISPNFLLWKFCGKAHFPYSFRRFLIGFISSYHILIISNKNLKVIFLQCFIRLFKIFFKEKRSLRKSYVWTSCLSDVLFCWTISKSLALTSGSLALHYDLVVSSLRNFMITWLAECNIDLVYKWKRWCFYYYAGKFSHVTH